MQHRDPHTTTMQMQEATLCLKTVSISNLEIDVTKWLIIPAAERAHFLKDNKNHGVRRILRSIMVASMICRRSCEFVHCGGTGEWGLWRGYLVLRDVQSLSKSRRDR